MPLNQAFWAAEITKKSQNPSGTGQRGERQAGGLDTDVKTVRPH